jgi:hypothetical protein
MVLNIENYQTILCKISHFLGDWTVSVSAFILLTTAIDRYRKICHPLQRQIQLPSLKYLIVGGIILCLLLSGRLLWTFDTVEVTIAIDESNSTLKGYHCAANCDGRYKYICLAFYVIDFAIISIGSVIIIVLYSKTIYTLFKRRSDMRISIKAARTVLKSKKAKKCHAKNSSAESANSSKLKMAGSSEEPTSSCSENSITSIACSEDDNDNNSDTKCTTKKSQKNKNASKKAGVSCATVRNGFKTKYSSTKSTNSIDFCSVKQSFEWNITFMMFATTIVFLVCFFPYFIIRVFIRLVLRSGKEYNFSPLIQFALKLPYLNSAFNPIVYSIFNVKFRRFIKRLISKCCWCRRK